MPQKQINSFSLEMTILYECAWRHTLSQSMPESISKGPPLYGGPFPYSMTNKGNINHQYPSHETWNQT